MKQHKVYEVRYSAERDAFETWLAITDGHYPNPDDFGMETSFPCCKSNHDSKGEPEFIHYEILKRIARAQDLGYEIIWRI